MLKYLSIIKLRVNPKITSYRYSSIERKKIPVVSDELHRYVFGNVYKESFDENRYKVEDIKIPQLPELYHEGDILKHFEILGKERNKNYNHYLRRAFEMKEIPPIPKEWAYWNGWVKYDSVTGEATKVDYPDGDFLIFDVEVCVTEGRQPTLAVALSETNWFSWCSDRLINDTPIPKYLKPHDLIPMESKDGDKEKIVIGHNVAYDRSRVCEQYYLKPSKTAFWDTMSMAIAMFSVSDSQTAYNEKKDYNISIHSEYKWLEKWKEGVSKYNLKDLYEYLIPLDDENYLEMEKDTREYFVKGDMNLIRENFQMLTLYCAKDVLATLRIYQKMYNEFMYRFPSDITRFGMIQMANVYLPINHYWNSFEEHCDNECNAIIGKLNKDISKFILKLNNKLKSDYKYDPWMFGSDWSIDRTTKKPKWLISCFVDGKKFNIENCGIKFKAIELPKVFGICYGPYPLYYIKEYGWGYLKPLDETETLSKKKRRKLTHEKIPEDDILGLIERNKRKNVKDIYEKLDPVGKVGSFLFYRLPHQTKTGSNVGGIFTKNYQSLFDDKVLYPTRGVEMVENLNNNLIKTAYWVNFQERFKQELPIWNDDEGKNGVIAPSVVPAGTITRRSTHKLWLTVTGAKDNVIGSNLKSLVQAPEGYKLVGADVDSQEQWLAAIMGDSIRNKKYIGDSLFSYLVLMGSKNEGTDLHTVVAKESGISRNVAKILNYARLYGSGPQHATTTLIRHNIPEEEAKELAEKTFEKTKGKLGIFVEVLPKYKDIFMEWFNSDSRSKGQLNSVMEINERTYVRICDNSKKKDEKSYIKEEFYQYIKMLGQNKDWDGLLINDIKKNCFSKYSLELYYDGIESDTFNFLNLHIQKEELRTPVLRCKLGNGLHPRPKYTIGSMNFLNIFKRSITNWVIQSSAVDFLHMLLLNMDWLCKKYNINARFCISIHDEVRYLVKEEDVGRAALALNLSNFMVRAAISEALGIYQLPYTTAFFSQIDIDTVLRKEVNENVTTIDNKIIKPGVALTYDEVIDITGGKLSK